VNRVLAAALSMMLTISAAYAEREGGMPVAGSDDLIWFVCPRLDGRPGWSLMLHARRMGGPFAQPVSELSSLPERLAAWGDAVWLMYPPEPGGTAPIREVVSKRAMRNPVSGEYVTTPTSRFEVHASLREPGRLLAFTGAPEGPVAILGPRRREGVKLAKVLALREQVWRELGAEGEWPAIAPDDDLCASWQGGEQGSLLVAVVGSKSSRLRLITLGGGETAQAPREMAAPPHPLEALLATRGQMVGLFLQPDGGRICRLLRPSGFVDVATFPSAKGAVALAADAERVKLIEFTTRRELWMLETDILDGKTSTPARMSFHPSVAGPWRHVPLVGAAVIFILLLALFIDQVSPKTQAVELAGLSWEWRLVALGIDLALAAAATMLIMRCEPADLVKLPAWTLVWRETAPAVVMAGLTVLHGFVGELWMGRSVGLAIVGGRVVAKDGERAGFGGILVRNVVKFVTILSPALGVLVLLDRHGRSAADILGRVRVIRVERTREPDGANRAD
jgi:uncharacterized RDD family membrane protein YckC